MGVAATNRGDRAIRRQIAEEYDAKRISLREAEDLRARIDHLEHEVASLTASLTSASSALAQTRAGYEKRGIYLDAEKEMRRQAEEQERYTHRLYVEQIRSLRSLHILAEKRNAILLCVPEAERAAAHQD